MPGFQGTARGTLAEYRKPGVRLQVTGQPESERMKLRFEARDYLGRPAPGGKVQWTAQILRNPPVPASDRLNGSQFVHAGPDPSAGLRLENLSEEERLLLQVDG